MYGLTAPSLYAGVVAYVCAQGPDQTPAEVREAVANIRMKVKRLADWIANEHPSLAPIADSLAVEMLLQVLVPGKVQTN